MTRWKVQREGHSDRFMVLNHACAMIAADLSEQTATQIVRDHNRAEAFEVMRKALQGYERMSEILLKREVFTQDEFEKLKTALAFNLPATHAALAHAEQVDSKP